MNNNHHLLLKPFSIVSCPFGAGVLVRPHRLDQHTWLCFIASAKTDAPSGLCICVMDQQGHHATRHLLTQVRSGHRHPAALVMKHHKSSFMFSFRCDDLHLDKMCVLPWQVRWHAFQFMMQQLGIELDSLLSNLGFVLARMPHPTSA